MLGFLCWVEQPYLVQCSKTLFCSAANSRAEAPRIAQVDKGLIFIGKVTQRSSIPTISIHNTVEEMSHFNSILYK